MVASIFPPTNNNQKIMAIEGLQSIQTENTTDRDVLRLLNDITDIPRTSKNEGPILDFIVKELREAHGENLQIEKDAYGNMAVHLPANDEKYKNSPRVVIQGHVDMVCKNGNDLRPVNAKVEGDRIVAPNETLGADNAVGGIAVPLAVLRNKDFKHGPITLLFTVQEEIGMKGASNLDPKLIPDDSAIFINIDSEEGPNKVFYGSAGGSRIQARFDMSEKIAVPEDYDMLQINLFNFPGGHSGLKIHERPRNAIKEMTSLLLELRENSGEDFMLMQITGGEKSNSVPETSMSHIAVPKNQSAAVRKMIDEICRREKRSVKVECVERATNESYVAIAHSVKDKILHALDTIPHGPLKTSPENPNHILTSNNVALLTTFGDTLEILNMARSNENTDLDSTEKQVCAALEEGNAQITDISKYYRWRENTNSPAIRLIQNASREVTGEEPSLEEAHCGLETGTIALQILPRTISMGSFGPTIGKAHEAGEFVIIEDIFDTRKMLEHILTSAATNDNAEMWAAA